MIKNCANCGKEFNVKPSDYERRVNCSNKCYSDGSASLINLPKQCIKCGETKPAFEYYLVQPTKTSKRKTPYRFQPCLSCYSKKDKFRLKKIRLQVLEAYGNACVCCGETTEVFLCIDHINNDGHIERKQGITGYRLYRMLVKLGFPKDRYQILCFNCNSAKKILGICPHQTN